MVEPDITHSLLESYSIIMSRFIFSQGRPGSDGARGMPGQSGPKVAFLAYLKHFNTPYFKINDYIFDSHPKTVLPVLLRETEALMVWQDFLVKKETE